jgi:ATP-dependent DNA helicase DinG
LEGSSQSHSDIDALFQNNGALARQLKSFCVRSQQIEMARAVKSAIEHRQCLIAEAGTGTGKTFAYLVPTLYSGEKAIISTGTKTLQDQLFWRDLPLVRDALKLPLVVAQLKGRANYLCLHKLEAAQQQDLFPTPEDARYLTQIISFSRTTPTGDKSAFTEIPENAQIWSMVTSTRESCPGSQCAHADDCFLLRARKEALDADIVVVNHYLLLADIMLQEEGLSELLPKCRAIVLDEAHQIPDIATTFFGDSVGSAEIADFVRDAEVAIRVSAADTPELLQFTAKVTTALRQMRLTMGDTPQKFDYKTLSARSDFMEAAQTLGDALYKVGKALEEVAERAEDLGALAKTAQRIHSSFIHWFAEHTTGDDALPDADTDTKTHDALAGDEGETIRWADVSSFSWQLYVSPLSVAPMFKNIVKDSDAAWIFTSATLAVGNDFSHFQRELGLDDAQTMRWDSPFDFKNIAQLYVPRDLPLPSAPEHTEAVVNAALPVLEASNGRAFFLFTSHRALKRAHEILIKLFEEKKYPWLLLAQGMASRPELLNRFREDGNAVLLGTQSFWEGVDVAGRALELVIIDKLPFAPPDDPLLSARIKSIKDRGGEPFFEWQLPQAAIALKQGAGRLIRTEQDRGVLMICDTRLVDKGYGKKLWMSLPPMRRTRDLAQVIKFFGFGKK